MITFTVIVIDPTRQKPCSAEKNGLACANVNCSQDYSLGEITAIKLCCIDEMVLFSEKSPLHDPIRYQLVYLTPANYAAMLSHTW